MAGKRSKEVRASRTNETVNEAVEESVHELGNEGTLDRGAPGANRSDEDATLRVDENEAIRTAEGVVTRSRGNVSNPPRTRPRIDLRGALRAAILEPQRFELMIRLQLDLERSLWLAPTVLAPPLDLAQALCA